MIPPCPLSELARVGLGYKSLQNQFFYVDKKTLATFKIEKQFIVPILRMKDLNGSAFLQKAKGRRSLFFCDLDEADLRGTGALRYIRAMADSPAAPKKQSRRPETMKEVLSAQSGKFWYGPKAQAHKAHIWVRKAFDSVYAPFLFEKEMIVDQRCNFVRSRSGINWQLISAILSSSLFALAAECQGAASMGAGALEIPTKILRQIRVPDVRRLSKKDKRELIKLGWTVWHNDSPVDWRTSERPGKHLRKLDEWLLARLNGSVEPDRLYRDIVETSRARFRLAQDKQSKEKKAVQHDIEGLAESIAASVRPLLEGRQFPEAFCPPHCSLAHHDFAGQPALTVRMDPFMNKAFVVVRNAQTDSVLLEETLPRDVAHVIVRSLLMGRRQFDVPTEPDAAEATLRAYFAWIPSILNSLEEGCRNSALGTRFEEQVREAAMKRLHLNPNIDKKEVFGEFDLA